jgi:hypothetical protein
VEPVPPSTSDATASTADPRRHNVFFLSRRDFSLWTKNYCFDHRGHRVPYTRKYWIARMKKKPKVTKFVWMFIQVFLFDAVVPGSDLSFAARDCFAAKDRQSTHRVLDGTHTQLQLHHDDRLGMATTPEPPATGNGRPARESTPRR